MQKLVRSALLGALALAPTAALAQMVIEEPAVVVGEPVVAVPAVGTPVVAVPVVGAEGVTDDVARMIAMANGIVEVEDVDEHFWNGNFEVEGTDASGNDLEITIDGQTGAVLEIDD
jgi:hypothetical protein